MVAKIYGSHPSPHLAAKIASLVAKLRFYLGGANYRSDKYKGTHMMLFWLEEQLHALDLDGERVFREDRSLEAVELLYRLIWVSDRLGKLVEDMEAVSDEAGAGGGTGGCAAAAQAAIDRWLSDKDKENLLRMKMQIDILGHICQTGKPLLDKARYSLAESERLNRMPYFVHDIVDQVEGRCGGATLAKVSKRVKRKLRIRRLLLRR
ncbi:hypothetical protein QOZ80_7BG0601370 [Eleusine coracana subsp. coracana]|nr:hypothetical protein QOZ80_7BG0601370 [Eleusine coracana subsp. coracana]